MPSRARFLPVRGLLRGTAGPGGSAPATGLALSDSDSAYIDQLSNNFKTNVRCMPNAGRQLRRHSAWAAIPLTTHLLCVVTSVVCHNVTDANIQIWLLSCLKSYAAADYEDEVQVDSQCMALLGKRWGLGWYDSTCYILRFTLRALVASEAEQPQLCSGLGKANSAGGVKGYSSSIPWEHWQG